MIVMAEESSKFSDELGVLARGPSVNLTTYDPRLFNCLGNDFNTSAAAFNYPSGFNARTEDSVGSMGLTLSTPQTGSSPEDSSVPWSTPAEEILRRSNDHLRPHVHYEPLDDGDISMAVEGISYNLDVYDWYPSAHQDNYTLNEAWPASSLHDNSVTELQDGMFSLEYSMANPFSDRMVWNVDDLAVPMSTTPAYFGGESVVQGQLFTPSIKDQNVPSLMVTEPGMASGNMNIIESHNISFQEMDLLDPHALNSNFGLLEAPSLNAGPRIIEPIASVDRYNNCVNATPPVQDVVWSSNLVATSGNGSLPLSTAQLPTSHSTSSAAEMSENLLGRTTVTTKPMPIRMRQKNVSILPAPAKANRGTSHASNGLGHHQQICSPKDAQPRRSDRRRLTAQERKNAKRVRQIGSCVPCALNKRRVTMFYMQAVILLLTD
jgi:hypothetical protein